MNPKPIVQFSQLGKFGRFGNQLFQYAFARAYAERYDAELQTPHWVGEKIFKIEANPITKTLPRTEIDSVRFGRVNIDLFGYFQLPRFIDFLSTAKLREWFQFRDKWFEWFPKSDEFTVVAHLRRGDYETKYSNVFCTVSRESYEKTIEDLELEDPYKLLWLSEEDQKHDGTLGSDLQFLPDFFEMINADILLRANSTFSFWAGFFNQEGKVYSPVVGDLVGEHTVPFVQGNHEKIVSLNGDFVFKD